MNRSDASWPQGDGELAGWIRAHAWAATPLGPIAGWSERLRLMVEQVLASPLVSCLACGPERILVYNDAAARLYGDRHPAALGRPLPGVFPETWPLVAAFYKRVFAGESVHVPAQPLDLGGGEVFDAYLTPVHDAAGAVIAAHMIGFEISDRLRTETALRASEERLARALEAGEVGVWELDLVTREAWRSPQHDRIFGYGTLLPEWTYDLFLAHVAPEDRDAVDACFREAIAANRRWTFECRILRADGELRWIGAQGRIDAGAGDGSRRIKGTVRDITERKRAEIALHASEERFHHVVRATRDITWDIDLVADRVWWSEALQTELGYPAEAVGPDTAWRFAQMHPDDRERVVTGMKAAAAGTDSVWSADFRYRRADATYAHIADRGFITRDASGRALRMTGAMQDITVRERAEAALRESEKRQSFLLKLSDALRPLRDTGEARAEACRLLGEHLQASRAYYVAYRPEEGCGIVADDYRVQGLPSLAGRYPFATFRATYERIGDGRTWIVPDVTADLELPARERAFYAAQDVFSWVSVPLAKGGVLEAALCVVQTEPRDWTGPEIALVEETAERMWAAIQRGRIEVELRESERRFAQFAASSSDALWIRNADTLAMEYVSPAIRTIYGIPPQAILGDLERWLDLILPEDRGIARGHLEAARSGEALVHEFRIRRASDGEERWIRNTDFPLRDGRGQVQRIGGIAEDVTAMKGAEATLAAAEARQRALVEGIPHLVWRAVDIGSWTWASPQWTAYTGQSEPDSRGWGWLEPLHPDDRGAAREAWDDAFAHGGFQVEYRVLGRAEGAYRWFQTRAMPVRDAVGAIVEWLGTSTDIHDLRTMQARQEILVNELQHRSRNLLGVVTAIADRTVLRGGSVPAFADRLQALGRAQGLLSAGGSDTVEVGALVRAELAAHADGASGHPTIAGPTVHLTARQVQNFALALHELTTNAVKYGALHPNVGIGQLAVTWGIVLDRRERRRLALSWIESGVTVAPDAAARRGYGTELIQEALAYALEARVDYDLGPDGVRYRIEMPVA